MLPQPLPDDPAPPPSKAALRSQRWWRCILWVGLFSIGGLLVYLCFPTVIRSYKDPAPIEAVNNARQIGLALFEFDTEYGNFPDATTIAAVKRKTGSLLPMGTKSSNDFFRQLIAAEIITSESVFYAKIKNCKKPDGRIGVAKALQKGECGFSYIAGLSSKGNPSRPLVVTPLIPGATRFDSTSFHGKAIILRMDNSVTLMPINGAGLVMSNGMNLLDPANPVWGGEKFSIAWPDL